MEHTGLGSFQTAYMQDAVTTSLIETQAKCKTTPIALTQVSAAVVVVVKVQVFTMSISL